MNVPFVPRPNATKFLSREKIFPHRGFGFLLADGDEIKMKNMHGAPKMVDSSDSI